MFEKAKWIAKNVWDSWSEPPIDNLPPSPYIARSFDISDKISEATLNICALGQGAYYINGKRIPDSYLPSHPSNYAKTIIYQSYDIKDLLREGKNRLGIIIGNNKYADSRVPLYFGCPKMICQLDIVYESGKVESIVSDSSFRCHDSFVLFSHARCGEIHDASLKIDNWCDPAFDDSDWDNVRLALGPGGALRPTKCPPRRVSNIYEGKEISKGLFDFGITTSGFANVKIKGKKGAKITVIYSEDISEDGKHAELLFNRDRIDSPMKHKGEYILSGGEDEFEDLFSYHGFRYLELCGDYESATVSALSVHTDIAVTSHFECDNDTVNKIYAMCENSILTNCQVAMVDCPQREQNEWTGDGMLTAKTVSMCYDSYEMYYEWMRKFLDDQTPDGKLPCIVPAHTSKDFYGGNGLDWSSSIVHIPYYAYKYSGNKDIISLTFNGMEKMMDYFAKTSDSNLINTGLGDWAAYNRDICPIEITDTIYYRIDALMMAELADELGFDGEKYRNLAEKIKSDFRNKYVKDGRIDDYHLTAIICAIYAGMLEEDEVSNELERISQIIRSEGGAITSGVHGYYMMFDVFTKYGKVQELFDVITNPDVPGYAKAVHDGYTTIPENFNYGGLSRENSRNHHFKAMVNSWLIEGLAGIRFEGFGFDNVTIEPHFVKGINNLKASALGISVEYDEKCVKIDSPRPFTLILGGEKRTLPEGSHIIER